MQRLMVYLLPEISRISTGKLTKDEYVQLTVGFSFKCSRRVAEQGAQARQVLHREGLQSGPPTHCRRPATGRSRQGGELGRLFVSIGPEGLGTRL